MRAIGVSLFTFICWHDWPPTTGAKSRQTWLASSRGGDFAQKCKHLISSRKETLSFNISNIFGWQAEESLLGGWRWLSGKVKRTMMNWSGSVCFYFPLTYQDLTSLSWQNSNLNRGVYKWRIQRWSRIIFSVALEISWIYLNKHSLWILMPNFWESLALCPLNLVALQWLD